MTIDFSLKDLRVILNFAENSISELETNIKNISLYDLENILSDKIKERKQELETMYAYRIHLYTEIGKLKV